MSKICIFAGTTEGRLLAERLGNQPIEVLVCVATDYGETLLAPTENLKVSAKRLSEQEMEELFRKEQFSCVVDATHPYATEVTENILAACTSCGIKYLRLLRGASQEEGDAVVVSDTKSAAEFLASTDGNILLTTGSKELSVFAPLASRIYARVLPMESSFISCKEAGIEPSHILAMQGPFSVDMNLALLKSCAAAYLVTKEGGRSGGFAEKMEAAKQYGATMVIIGRPEQKSGMEFSELLNHLCRRFGLHLPPKVRVVGMGPGSEAAMTEEVQNAIKTADCLIGAKRMLKTASAHQTVYDAISPEKIAQFIQDHSEYHSFTVIMSGDTGFFSGTKKLIPLLHDCDVEILPGLSSLSYLCAKLGESYEDVVNISLHGRAHNLVPDVRRYPRIFTLTGGENSIDSICRQLCDAQLGDVKVSVGERLSYPEEKVTIAAAKELCNREFDSLSAALIENPAANPIVTHGLPDELFQRGSASDGAVVPMTKMEVRSVALSKLQLTKRAVCWDIGAGTGSVAIEMAMQTDGDVYAIERKEDAVDLLKENCRKFGTHNVTAILGTAPEGCEDLPAPTHVFIGGSAGNMKDILELILQKNPHARIVATAVTLESIGELCSCMKQFSFAETVCITSARDRRAGSYHLMMGQNPIHIFTLQNE